jgi:hypothetical protein
MDSWTIDKLLKRFPCYQGVYALDKIPKLKKLPCAIIINTDPASKPGEHWVSVIIDEEGNGEYFDSFGLQPLHEEIIKYLDKYCSSGWCFNPIALQSTISTTCGHYCVLYVMFRCLGYTYIEYLSIFTSNSLENDNKMIEIFGKYSF